MICIRIIFSTNMSNLKKKIELGVNLRYKFIIKFNRSTNKNNLCQIKDENKNNHYQNLMNLIYLYDFILDP